MRDYSAYIESLENAEQKMTCEDWKKWIVKENADLRAQDERIEKITENDIDYIVKCLEHDGYVIA